MDYTMKKQSGSLAVTDLTFGCIFMAHDSHLLHLLKHQLLVQSLLTWSKSRTELGRARPTASTWSFRQSLPSFHIKYSEVSKVFKTILFKNYIILVKKTNSYCRRQKEREREWGSESFASQAGRFWQTDTAKYGMAVWSENMNPFTAHYICKIIPLPQSLSRRKKQIGTVSWKCSAVMITHNLVINKPEEISLHRIQYVKQAVWCINETLFLRKLHCGSQHPMLF